MAMSDSGGFVSAESEGFTVSSNTETAEGLADNLASEAPDEVSEAAAKLGKKGGKASAATRSARTDSDGSESGEGLEQPEDGEEAQTTPEKPLGKPRDDPKARMLEATRKEAEAKREARRLAEENAELKRRFESYRPPQQEQAAPKDPNAPPDKADFDDYEAYIDARAEWKARQEWARQRQEADRDTWVNAQAKRMADAVDSDMSNFTGKMQAVKETNPERIEALPPEMMDALVPTWMLEPGQTITQRNVMADEIMKLDHPLEVLEHLSQITEFQRIATLSNPPAITRALARLDARFEAATAAVSPKPTISKAKPPVRAVAGSPGAVERDEDSLSIDEFLTREVGRSAHR
jgi:hypothetical protein